MNHEALQRKLAHLEQQIQLAEANALSGAAPLPGIALTLDDAIRVAANIRNRLAGTSSVRKTYHVSRTPTSSSSESEL